MLPEIKYYLNDTGTSKFLWCGTKDKSVLVSFVEIETHPVVYHTSHFTGNILMSLSLRTKNYREITALEAGVILHAANNQQNYFIQNKKAPHPFRQEAIKQVT